MPFGLQLPRSKKIHVGVDVGARAVKLICLEQRGDGLEYVAHGLFKRIDTLGIRSALLDSKLRNAELSVSIKNAAIKMQKVELPRVPPEEVEQMIKWSVREAFPGSVDDYVLKYVAYQNDLNSAMVPYTVFAVEKKFLTEYLTELKDLGMQRIVSVEPVSCALANFVAKRYSFKQNEIYAVFDCGESQASLIVCSAERLMFFRLFLGASGENLTIQISRDLGVPKEQAELYKTRQHGELSEEEKRALASSIMIYLSKLSVELQNSIDSYHVQFPRQPVTHVLLSGAGCQLVDMQPILEKTLKVPLAFIEAPEKISIANFLGYGTAAGLIL